MKSARKFFGTTKKGGEKTTTSSGSSAPKQEGRGGNVDRNQGATQPQRNNNKPKNPAQQGQKQNVQSGKSTRNAQSALRPGNQSGLIKQKEHPMIQFGPILKEFLASRELVDQEIGMKYNRNLEKFDIVVSFKTVLPNGVSVSAKRDLTIEDYLAERKVLLNVKDESSHYVGFVTRGVERIGLDLTKTKPSVAFRSVENFVLKHLSPVEKVILQLTTDEFDRVDTRKIPEILKPTVDLVTKHYGSMEKRNTFLVKTINTEGEVSNLEPPNWVLGGVSGISKGVLLDALKLQHTPTVTAEQQQLIKTLAASIFGSDEAGDNPLEEAKRDDTDKKD